MEDLTQKTTISTPQAVQKKVGSFFGRVSPDAWITAAAIILGSLFVVAALLPPMEPKSPKAETANEDTAPAPKDQAQSGETSIDNDPVMGDAKKAKVAIVEFSDFECPFCKKFHEEAYQKLIDKYVTTGKAVWVARDFPLSFHDPVATTSAGIANCVFTQKGSSAYYALSSEMYKNTLTNGKGIPQATLDKLIAAQGVNAASIKTCAATEAVKSEITADIEAGSTVGIEGTPSFVIGTLDEQGNVKGEVVVGAQPLTSFEKIIDKYLQ